jgi:hypothetical protein
MLYAARINALDGIRRVRASDDDAVGPQADYIDQPAITNELAVFTPYEITFRCFGQDLAMVLSSFATSPHGFIVKAINVQPAAGANTTTPAPGSPGFNEVEVPAYARPVAPSRPAAPPGRGGLQTVLDEQLLSVTLQVEIVKLTSGN